MSGGRDITRKVPFGAQVHYSLMSIKEIIALKEMIMEIAEDNCHLYLWVTNSFLPDGLIVMKEWGFRYVTKLDWLKINKEGKLCYGMGRYFSHNAESCLFGVKGNLPYKKIKGKKVFIKSGFLALRKRHSEKPEEMRIKIETVSYPPYIELFARKKSDNWDVWGNEV